MDSGATVIRARADRGTLHSAGPGNKPAHQPARDGGSIRIPVMVAVVYLIMAAAEFAGGGGGTASTLLAAMAAAISGWGFVMWAAMQLGWISPRGFPAALFSIGLLMLGESLAAFFLTSDPGVFAIVLLVVGAAMTLPWERFAVLAGAALVGWAPIAALRLPPSALELWLPAIAGSIAVGGVVAWIRHRRKKAPIEDPAEAAVPDRAGHLEAREALWARAVEGSQDGFWHWDLKTNAFEFSAAWERLLGYQKGELRSKPEEWFNRVHPGYLPELKSELIEYLKSEARQPFKHAHRMQRNDGSLFWAMARATAIRDNYGVAVALAGSHSDITSLIEVERRVLDDTFVDKLTGLPNRHFLMARLETAIERKRKRGANAPLFGVMFLDLDKFKTINDTLGHLVGDQLLTSVAGRLQKCIRSEDIVARFGGDEFVVLLSRLRDPEEAIAIGRRIREALTTPHQIGDREIQSGGSIGVALSLERFETAEEFVRLADVAMYHSKTERKGQVQIYNPRMDSNAPQSSDLQNELARALERNEFVLHYQPFVSLPTGSILGVEALIRWQRPDNTLMSPAHFIPVAEESGLINDIGDWALRTACAQNSAWQRAGVAPVRVAVNLSARQLQQQDFPQKVVRILDETHLPVRCLELELTETALMDSLNHAPETLKKLGSMGIRTSIDDFGTGYSSLNYLRRFDFQTLKMDRVFVSDITTDEKAAAVARGLISLAHNLGLSVVAEGVEHGDQLSFLAAEQCDQVQGFLTSRPLPPEQLIRVLRTGNLRERIQLVRQAGLPEQLAIEDPVAVSTENLRSRLVAP